jgi:hypothetical protein
LNNKISSPKRISLIFLIIILIIGVISLLNTTFITNSQAQIYENQYHDDESYYNYKEDNRYGYDNKHLEKDQTPKIFPNNKVSELGNRWSQWAFGIDISVINPFTEDLGQEGCDVGLQDSGRLLFLAGAPRDPNTGDFPLHECEVKNGTSILIPILNVICNDLVVGSPLFATNEQDQRICANNIITDATLFDNLQVNIDGIEIQTLKKYRIDSPAGGFEFTSVPNNVFNTPIGDGNGVSDGFWILLKDLKPGKHIISFSGALDLDKVPPLIGLYEAGATYVLFVEPIYYY